MSLQRRLTLFFILIVILPLAAAGFVVQRVVVDEVANRAILSLDPALDASVAIFNERIDALEPQVRARLGQPELADALDRSDARRTASLLRESLDRDGNLDFLLARDRRERSLAAETSPGRLLEEADPPDRQELVAAEGGAGPGFARSSDIPVRIPGRGVVGYVAGGFWLDQNLLEAASQENVHLSLVTGGQLIASTADVRAAHGVEVELEEDFTAEIGGNARAKARRLGPSIFIVASTPTSPVDALANRVMTSMLGLLVVALVGTGLLAFLLARLITQPLEELTEGARAISEGRYDHRIAVRSKDEVGQLAMVFNDMTDHLSDTYTALSSSRDRLHRAVRRVGETLRSTHDMAQLMDSILNTAVDAVDGEAGVIWRLTSTRDDLYVSASVGIDPSTLSRVPVGQGVVGLVAERAAHMLFPSVMGDPRRAVGEPDPLAMIAIPLYSGNQVMGVLAVYRFESDAAFSDQDMETVTFLAEQGGVAIENVLLHEEAQRLSLMDGLTGTWNRRFFQMQFRQVLATATRFERPFSLLMLDLDEFKAINDTYGHQRGDAILVEFAQRVDQTLREVDTLARYGGEEFIVLLSETDREGALVTAQKICDVIRSEPFGVVGEEPIKLTVSIGVATYPMHGDIYRSLLEAADRALYAAKQGGRDRAADASTQSSQLKLAT